MTIHVAWTYNSHWINHVIIINIIDFHFFPNSILRIALPILRSTYQKWRKSILILYTRLFLLPYVPVLCPSVPAISAYAFCRLWQHLWIHPVWILIASSLRLFRLHYSPSLWIGYKVNQNILITKIFWIKIRLLISQVYIASLIHMSLSLHLYSPIISLSLPPQKKL